MRRVNATGTGGRRVRRCVRLGMRALGYHASRSGTNLLESHADDRDVFDGIVTAAVSHVLTR
ncbi:hypothetical protein [Mycolicibacterium arenosum]|uniref:TetR family transcriptional regulator n=1 Tax=Mycolicibacterium arenosum TaxID=2952157 RepID=A0ABT1MFE9_9MYCO|nr:hypothetical protein [Mycolicibacterium sp. CAU 1645]MCP9276492.1 hypothetical protein [Mycolicibacterium sp. CAU 1645]